MYNPNRFIGFIILKTMSHSLTKIWIHVIIGVKGRRPLIKDDMFHQIVGHIEEQMRLVECKPLLINGTSDHLHVLYNQSPKISVSDVWKQIKGETSHWINQEDILSNEFNWQVGYGAFSEGYPGLPRVRRYIENQKAHHKKISFEEELEEILSWYDLRKDF